MARTRTKKTNYTDTGIDVATITVGVIGGQVLETQVLDKVDTVPAKVVAPGIALAGGLLAAFASDKTLKRIGLGVAAAGLSATASQYIPFLGGGDYEDEVAVQGLRYHPTYYPLLNTEPHVLNGLDDEKRRAVMSGASTFSDEHYPAVMNGFNMGKAAFNHI